MAPLPLEVAVFSSADALLASSLGAARIELNRPGSYPSGGLTPPPSAVAALSALLIPIRVMIRPRGAPINGDADFVYTTAELEEMRAAIAEMKASGGLDVHRGDGFVFGVVKEEGGKTVVDERTCKALVDEAAPFGCVFHRAFDGLADVEGGVDVLQRCGFVGVLTAGGPTGGCMDNLTALGGICATAKEGAVRLEVVAGGGVRHHNVAALRRGGGCAPAWVHSAALRADGTGLDEDELRRLLKALAKEEA